MAKKIQVHGVTKINFSSYLTSQGKKNVRLLKDLNVFIPYFKAALEQKELSNIVSILNYEKDEVINYAFSWATSKEGHDFWEKKDELLRKKYYEYDENLPW